jgi:hypothetical protein
MVRMTWTEFALLGALALSLYNAWQLRGAKKWEARMNARIRKQVEKEIQSHAAKLRVSADLQLRVHERAWDLLRDVIGSGREVDRALDRWFNNEEYNIAEVAASSAAFSALGKLEMLAATTPPHYPIAAILKKWQATAGRIHALGNMTMTEEQRTLIQGQVKESLENTPKDLHAVCERWNDDLWRAMNELVPATDARFRVAMPKPADGKREGEDELESEDEEPKKRRA